MKGQEEAAVWTFSFGLSALALPAFSRWRVPARREGVFIMNAFKSGNGIMPDDEFTFNKISCANIIPENVSITDNG